MVVPRARIEAERVYLLFSGASAFCFALVATLNLVYQAEVARLNPLQLVLVGTVLETVAFVCEVPTGIVADVYSRRLAIVTGTFLYGAGFLLEGLVPTFGAIVLTQVIWGVGATFISGAEQAWIADEVGEARAGPIFFRSAQVGQAATLVGIGVSVVLGSVQLNLPIVTGALLFLALGVFLALAMPERGFQPVPRGERHSWHAFGQTLWHGGRLIRRRPLILTILAIAACYGAASEGFDRLWQVHLLRDFTLPPLGPLRPVVWFGLLSAGALPLSIGATQLARRYLDTTSHQAMTRALLALNILRSGALLLFGLATSFPLAVAAFWLAATLRSVGTPLFTTWLNQQVDSRVRATVFSLYGQADALGQIAGGPVIGWIGTIASLRAALTATSGALLPAVPLFLRALRQGDAPAAPNPVPPTRRGA